MCLPRIVFNLAVELEGCCPVVAAAGVLDEGEEVGSDRTVTTMILVVSGTAGEAEECLLDG